MEPPSTPTVGKFSNLAGERLRILGEIPVRKFKRGKQPIDPDGSLLDRMTDSMKQAIGETNRRRDLQRQYNDANGITPESISKPIDMSLARIVEADYMDIPIEDEAVELPTNAEEMDRLVVSIEILFSFSCFLERKGPFVVGENFF